jgi:hypothetical protein
LFHRRIERMRVLQLLKIPYTTLLDLLLHLIVLHKLTLMKIHHLHNLLSIILQHVLQFQSLLTLFLLFKIHHLYNLMSIILYYVSLLTLPLLVFKIRHLHMCWHACINLVHMY